MQQRNETVIDEQIMYLQAVKFCSADHTFIVELRFVREIAEFPRVVPYPERCKGHLGLTSLRGEVLPMLCISENPRDHEQDDRVMVFEVTKGQPFCLPASDIKKVSVEKEKLLKGLPIEVDGSAAKAFTFDVLPGWREKNGKAAS